MKRILIVSLSAAALLMTGCAGKPRVSTAAIMSYDLTGVDISTLKSSKVCTSSENNDVSVRRAAELGGMSKVYGVDTEINYRVQVYGPDKVTSQCTIVYGK